MLSPHETQGAAQKATGAELSGQPNLSPQPPAPSPCEINPRSVVEAICSSAGRIIGPSRRASWPRRCAASARRKSTPSYASSIASTTTTRRPIAIEEAKTGYRLVLRKEFERMRDKFYGRVREAKLSPAALEVLSIIAYNQPVDRGANQSASQRAERRGAFRRSCGGGSCGWIGRRTTVRSRAIRRPSGF